jgi:hypothetical protein
MTVLKKRVAPASTLTRRDRNIRPSPRKGERDYRDRIGRFRGSLAQYPQAANLPVVDRIGAAAIHGATRE